LPAASPRRAGEGQMTARDLRDGIAFIDCMVVLVALLYWAS
jgi:hypothetical protein